MRPQLGCALVFLPGRARCPPAASPARKSLSRRQGGHPHAGAIADRHLSTHHCCRRNVLTKSLRPYLGVFNRCRFQQHSEFLPPPIRAAMSVARMCSLNRAAKCLSTSSPHPCPYSKHAKKPIQYRYELSNTF